MLIHDDIDITLAFHLINHLENGGLRHLKGRGNFSYRASLLLFQEKKYQMPIRLYVYVLLLVYLTDTIKRGIT